jgi:hypothetical protein
MRNLLVLLLLACLSLNTYALNKNACMWCTIVARSAEMYIEFSQEPIEKALYKFCDLLGDKLAPACKLFVQVE